jgi:hypothetical protein
MDLLAMLRRFGDRIGIIEMKPASSQPSAPAKIQTRSVTLGELATTIQTTQVRELADLPAELSVSLEDIFKAAGIRPTATGWTVERLHQFLNSDPIRGMDRSAAQAEALRMLAAEKVEVEDLVKDAVSRDQALDAYEDSIARTREQRIRSLEDQRKRIEQQIVAEENRWLEWRKQKRRRERELAYAVGYLIDRPVITTDEE